MRKVLIFVAIIASTVSSGCSSFTKKDWHISDLPTLKIPGVYKVDVQQGNDVTQEQVNNLRPGMSRNQVRFALGTPLILDPFHQERWDYIYTLTPGGGEMIERRVSLYFKEDRLTRIEGDLRPMFAEQAKALAEQNRERTLVIPPDEPRAGKRSSYLDRIMKTIGIEAEE
ncbi:MAG: hypothetical protein BMS9Abin15_0347 [Gammaproteobacteria bacterium]|nr:MAG: hypothetical protein BMS9Abin15_0347 [Gammaproteobacteria bacterium]